MRSTSDRVLAALERRGVEIFARVDHGAGATRRGSKLGDEELLVFGDPRVGTLLMQADPAIGYELPLRLLVWDPGDGTRIGYRPASGLAEAYEVGDRVSVLARMDDLLEQVVAESIAQD